MKAAAARSTDVHPQPFPGDAAMHFGLGLLRLDPQTFWSLSLREFMALGGARGATERMDRAALAALMARWPDKAPAA